MLGDSRCCGWDLVRLRVVSCLGQAVCLFGVSSPPGTASDTLHFCDTRGMLQLYTTGHLEKTQHLRHQASNVCVRSWAVETECQLSGHLLVRGENRKADVLLITCAVLRELVPSMTAEAFQKIYSWKRHANCSLFEQQPCVKAHKQRAAFPVQTLLLARSVELRC